MRYRSPIDHGVNHNDAAAVTSIATNPTSRIGGAALRPGTPAARIAVISPSADMRLSVSRVPVSTPRGIANGNACGSTSANRYTTIRVEPELRTRYSNNPCASGRNSTEVNSAIPNAALQKCSRKMVRLSRRMMVSSYPVALLQMVFWFLDDVVPDCVAVRARRNQRQLDARSE